jgi:hypothetical protein
MGAPAVTWFCKNGHIVEDIPHHYISNSDPELCPYCSSRNLRYVTEWRDGEYGESLVDALPIRTESAWRLVSMHVYDVTRLFDDTP